MDNIQIQSLGVTLDSIKPVLLGNTVTSLRIIEEDNLNSFTECAYKGKVSVNRYPLQWSAASLPPSKEKKGGGIRNYIAVTIRDNHLYSSK